MNTHAASTRTAPIDTPGDETTANASSSGANGHRGTAESDVPGEIADGLPRDLASEIQDHTLAFRISGIAALITGLAAILMPHVATFAAGIALGVLFVINGAIGAASAYRGRSGGPMLGAFMLGLLSIVAGSVLLLQPFTGIVALTLFLAAWLIASGALRAWVAWRLGPAQGRGVLTAAAALSVLLGVLIASGLPGNAFWVLGLLVGVDLIFAGAALLATVRSVKRSAPSDQSASGASARSSHQPATSH